MVFGQCMKFVSKYLGAKEQLNILSIHNYYSCIVSSSSALFSSLHFELKYKIKETFVKIWVIFTPAVLEVMVINSTCRNRESGPVSCGEENGCRVGTCRLVPAEHDVRAGMHLQESKHDTTCIAACRAREYSRLRTNAKSLHTIRRQV